MSSNQVGRTDLTPIARRSSIFVLSLQAVVYGGNHPCGDKYGDELDVPCYL